jgi:hypothetical protein
MRASLRTYALFMAAITLSLTLAGCGIAQQQEMKARAAELKAQSEMAAQACDDSFPAGNTKTAVARAKCQAEAIAILRPIQPHPDLLDLYIATRLSVAEDVQNGRLSIAKGNEVLATKRAELVAEEQRRNLSTRAVAAQEDAAAASAAASWAANRPRSCTRTGNTVNCF